MQTPAKFTTHIVLAALGLIVYHQAQAARIEPAGSTFTAQGPISFSKGALISADCTIKVAGKVAADGTSVNVDKVEFDGGLKCSRVEAINLPWVLVAKDTKSGSMSKISVDVHAFGLGGKCGLQPPTVRGITPPASWRRPMYPSVKSARSRRCRSRCRPTSKWLNNRRMLLR